VKAKPKVGGDVVTCGVSVAREAAAVGPMLGERESDGLGDTVEAAHAADRRAAARMSTGARR
jgi:hypothetical protein